MMPPGCAIESCGHSRVMQRPNQADTNQGIQHAVHRGARQAGQVAAELFKNLIGAGVIGALEGRTEDRPPLDCQTQTMPTAKTLGSL